jgi:molybdopterin-binding protein
MPLVLKGKVTKLVEGAVNCEATLEIAPKTYAQTIAEQD